LNNIDKVQLLFISNFRHRFLKKTMITLRFLETYTVNLFFRVRTNSGSHSAPTTAAHLQLQVF